MTGHFHPFDFTRLRPFGCLVFAHTQNRQTKLGATAKRMVFVGLERGARADRLWDKSSGRIWVSGDVKHCEDVFPATLHSDHREKLTTPDTIPLQFPNLTEETNTQADRGPDDPSDQPTILPNTVAPINDVQDIPDTGPQESPADVTSNKPRRSTRSRATPTRYGFLATDISSQEHDHPTYNQAMQGPEAAAWRQACSEEFESLLQHKVGLLVEAPPGANILGGMWRLSRKRDEHNRIVRYKARWVAFGNHQIKGVDYAETYASVGSANSLRILLASTAGSDWVIWQFDIVTAFLNGKMDGTVYVRQVKDFEHPAHPHHVWLLNQSLYGTKKAARCWQKDFMATAAKFNLHPCPSDGAVYVLQDERGTIIIHLHVDDSLIFCSNITLMNAFKEFLDSIYKVKWTTSPTLYLGIKIDIRPDGTSLSQPQYIEAKLEEFGMVNCSMAKSPLPAKTVLRPGTPEDVAAAAELPYQNLVGSLQWLAHTTRPDIAYAVSQLSSFNASWTLEHWVKAKHVLCYLRFTQHQSL